jgi:primosomal protein N' (replication factor Y) (superfamily II helicase)
MYYCEMAIIKAHTGKKLFTYQSYTKLSMGDVYKVPFGKKELLAIVVTVVSKPTFATKTITTPLLYSLPKTSVTLMLWMFNYYPEDNGQIAKLFVPFASIDQHKTVLPDIKKGLGQPLPPATQEQSVIIKQIRGSKNKRVLLHGDTGTGKTHVFIEIAKKIISQGQSVLILTPEIGLTPQLTDDLVRYLPVPVILTHSALTPVQRRRIWQWVLSNDQPTVYIGPRSALFLPFTNLGLIVIDEAHDNSYKQLQSPKYQSLQVAGQLANLHDCLLVQSTATPNVEHYEIAKAHHFNILRMTETAAGQHTAQTHIIDINNRELFSQSPHLSDPLIAAIKQTLLKHEQVMLFLNRRGSARLVQCQQCDWQALCPNCNLPLIYHHDLHKIRCHTCGYQKAAPHHCPKCASLDIVFKVIGTKSLADHVQILFPRAVIARFDADSESDQQYYQFIHELKTGKIDIIVGTQLISKGIDLPNLGIVGVINADSGLNIPDYRAEETTFQQLYQVTGRAVRGHRQSQLFIQTRVPEHSIIQAVKKRSWTDFYTYELAHRQAYDYPPMTHLAILKVTAKNSAKAAAKCHALAEQLKPLSNIKVLGPSPSFYEKTAKGYTWQIILKSPNRNNLMKVIEKLPAGWLVDIDPTSVL